MQLEHGKAVWVLGNRFLNRLGMFVAGFLTTRDQLCDDGEAVARGSLWKDRAVSALFHLVLEESSFRDCHGCGFRPSALLHL